MEADESGVTPSQRNRLRFLAADLTLGDGFRPEDAVRVAADLVADGADGDALIQLAALPADLTMLDGREVEALFRTVLFETGVEVPPRETAGWMMVRSIATGIVDGVIPPVRGAWRLWSLSDECDHPGELVKMLLPTRGMGVVGWV